MRRVLISGYYGFHNTGDDALLAVATWGARAMFGHAATLRATASLIPTFPGSETLRPTYPRTQRVRGANRALLHAEAAMAGSIVFGGGSVFHRMANLSEVHRLLWLAGRGPHIAAGVSIGPLKSRADERDCAKVLSRLAFIGARDSESASLAQALAPRVPSALTFDLAPLLPTLLGGAVGSTDRRGIGIALCDHERFIAGDRWREDARRERVAEVVRLVRSETDERITLIDFNGHPTFGDRAVHSDVAGRVQARTQVSHLDYRADPLEVLRTVAGLRVILAMRLHAAVFGFLADTPVVMLSYHPKCDGWADQIGLPPTVRHDSVDFDPRLVADQLVSAVRGEGSRARLSLEQAQDRARANFPLELVRSR